MLALCELRLPQREPRRSSCWDAHPENHKTFHFLRELPPMDEQLVLRGLALRGHLLDQCFILGVVQFTDLGKLRFGLFGAAGGL